MRKISCFIGAFSLLLAVPLVAQVAPAGQEPGAGINFWVGASISTFNPDYGCADGSPFSCWDHHLLGVGTYVDTNFFVLGKIGAEGEVRLMLWHGPATLIENSYLGGPRVRLVRFRHTDLTAKFLLGDGTLDVPGHLIGGGSYFAYAPGISIDYRVAQHVSARVEYEHQSWPGYKCFQCTNGGGGGLTPNGFSFGVSYKIPSVHSGD